MEARGRTCLSILMGMVLLAGAMGCQPLSKRVDPNQDDELGGTGIDSAEVTNIASKMARDLLSIPQIAQAQNPPTVALQPILNNTRFVIDTDIFLERITTLLIQNSRGRITFLSRDQLDAITEEKALKEEGVFSSGGKKNLLGADFFLTGAFRSISKSRDSKRSDFIQYTFKLVDTENSATVWQNHHDVKKVGKRGTVYR